MADMKLSAVFTFIDKLTAPVKNIIKTTEKLGSGFGKVQSKANSMADKINHAKKELDGLKKKQDETKKSSFGLAGAFGALSGILSITALVGIGKGIWGVNSSFEQYEATLTTLLGTQKKAKEAMAWVSDFAATTPYELDEVTGAFVKLNSYGINAMDGTLRAAGDWAAGMGKSLDQVVEAMADARTGEFERLKELGVVTKKAGDKVTFTFSSQGKMITKIAKNNAKDIQAALMDIATTNYAGAMIKQAKTAKGVLSNLHDWISGFQKKIGDAGVFDHVKNRLAQILENLNLLSTDGKAQAWAKKISDALIRLFDALDKIVSNVDWVKLIDSFTKFVIWLVAVTTAVTDFVDKMGGLENLMNLGIAAWIFNIVLGLNGLAVALGIVSIAGAPIWAIVAAIAALAAAAFLVWQNWDGIKKWWAELWLGIGLNISHAVAAIIEKFEGIKSKFAEVMNSLWNLMPVWMRGLIQGTLKLIAPDVQWPSAPNAPTAAIGQNSQNSHATVDINYNGPGAIKPQKSSKGLNVNTRQDLGYQGG